LLEVELGGTLVRLLAQRAAYLPEHGLLLVADAHIGKAASFRRFGVPVPEGTTAGTLARLAAAVAACGARQVVFLGDLLHSARGRQPGTLAEVEAWRDAHAALEVTLIRGNHDSHAGDPPAAWRVKCVDGPLLIDGLALSHHPDPVPGHYVLAGHVHPAVVLSGRANERLRLPCFHFGEAVGVLPAFGEFTGMHALPRAPGDRLFVVHGDAVAAVPQKATADAAP
jgi:uncharacterized protein